MISYELISLSTSPFQPLHHVTEPVTHNLHHTLFILPRRLPHGAFRGVPWLATSLSRRHCRCSDQTRVWQPHDIRRPQERPDHFLIYIWASTTEPIAALVPTLSLYFSLAMMAISWVSSFVVQIPLQLRIREEKDKGLVRTLIRTDWVRVLSMATHFGVVIWTVAA